MRSNRKSHNNLFCAFVLIQVSNGGNHNVTVFLQFSDSGIAISAKQAPNIAINMIVIYSQSLDAAMPSGSFRLRTNRANTVLSVEHLGILLTSDAETSFTFFVPKNFTVFCTIVCLVSANSLNFFRIETSLCSRATINFPNFFWVF